MNESSIKVEHRSNFNSTSNSPKLPLRNTSKNSATITDDLRSSELVASSVLQDLQFIEPTSRPQTPSSRPVPSSPAPISLLHCINNMKSSRDNSPDGQDSFSKNELNFFEGDSQMIFCKPIQEIDLKYWHAAIDDLPADVVRSLLWMTVQNFEVVRESIHQQILQHLTQWKETRLIKILQTLKKPFLKARVGFFLDRMTKLQSVANDWWEEQHQLASDFCKEMESYLSASLELSINFKQHFALCIEILMMISEGYARLCRIPSNFDINDALSQWTPQSAYLSRIFPSSLPRKGFTEYIFGVWGQVLHVACQDEDLRKQPGMINQLFVLSVKYDPEKKILHVLQNLHQNMDEALRNENKSLEIYESSFLKRKRALTSGSITDTDFSEITFPEPKKIKLTSPRRVSFELLSRFSV